MEKTKRKYCLDAFAVKAFLAGEPGGEKVKDLLQAAQKEKVKIYIHTINLLEIYYTTLQDVNKSTADEILVRIKDMPVEIVPFKVKDIPIIGEIKAHHKVSLADAFCIATAIEKNAIILTGDPEFKEVEKQVKIIWLDMTKNPLK